MSIIVISTLVTTNWIAICAYVLMHEKYKKKCADIENWRISYRELEDVLKGKTKD